MRVSYQGLEYIKGSEGLRTKAYQDTAGIWTIGYGHTAGVKPGDTCTREEALQFFSDDAAEAERAVQNSVRVQVNQNEYDAMVSLAFNIGGPAFETSTLVRKLNAGDRAGAADQFLVWNKITDEKTKQKVVDPGLVKRRNRERQLFLTPAGTDLSKVVAEAISETLTPGKKMQSSSGGASGSINTAKSGNGKTSGKASSTLKKVKPEILLALLAGYAAMKLLG